MHMAAPAQQEESGEQRETKDCLACKMTGSLTMSGLGAYAWYQASLLRRSPSLAAAWSLQWGPRPLRVIGAGD